MNDTTFEELPLQNTGNSKMSADFDQPRHGTPHAIGRGKPVVILIGADKGGVGKTTVARTLLDYFGAHQTPVRAFDTESPRGTLKRFHPDITEIVDVTSVADQMKIFDTLGGAGSRVTVIDVRAGLLASTLKTLSEIGFIESAKKAQITLAVFHVVGPSIASLDEISEIVRSVGNANYFLVKNKINDATFFEWNPATYNTYFKPIKDVAEICIPKLNEMACEQVEVASTPFVSFVANKAAGEGVANFSFVLRGYVRHWLGDVWSEYDRVHLLDFVHSSAETGNDEKDEKVSSESSDVYQAAS